MEPYIEHMDRTTNRNNTTEDRMNTNFDPKKLHKMIGDEIDSKEKAIERFKTDPALTPYLNNFIEMVNVIDHGIDLDWVATAPVDEIFAKLS